LVIETKRQVGTTVTCPGASPFPLAQELVKIACQNASTSFYQCTPPSKSVAFFVRGISLFFLALIKLGSVNPRLVIRLVLFRETAIPRRELRAQNHRYLTGAPQGILRYFARQPIPQSFRKKNPVIPFWDATFSQFPESRRLAVDSAAVNRFMRLIFGA
jgi:hypothetical protein